MDLEPLVIKHRDRPGIRSRRLLIGVLSRRCPVHLLKLGYVDRPSLCVGTLGHQIEAVIPAVEIDIDKGRLRGCRHPAQCRQIECDLIAQK